MKTIAEFKERQTEIQSRLSEINKENEGAPFSDEARAEWNTLNEERDANEKLIVELEARESRLLELAATPEARIDPRPSFGVHTRKSDADIHDLVAIRQESRNPDHEVELLRSNALRSAERSSYPHRDADKGAIEAHIERMLSTDDEGRIARRMLATGTDTYRRAFAKAATGREVTNEERTALSLTVGAGGYAVPYTLDPTVIPTSNHSVNPWRAVCRQESISVNTWNGLASGGVTAAYGSEATEATDGSPTFVQPTGTVNKAQVFVPFSEELEMDWGGLLAALAVMFQDAKDDLEAADFTTATGTAPKPVGILGFLGLTTAVRTQTATTAVFAVADLYSAEGALAARYRPRASFIANRGVYNLIRQFDTAGGANLFAQNLTVGLGNAVPSPGRINLRLLDYPTYECSSMVTTTTSASKILLFGDFSQFIIVDRIGMNVKYTPDLFGGSNRYPTGQSGVRAFWRNCTVLANNSAFRYLAVL